MIQELLDSKRDELVWALAKQKFTHEDIAYILRGVDRSNVTRMISRMPDGWEPKWVKKS